jgi:hypothetical protein
VRALSPYEQAKEDRRKAEERRICEALSLSDAARNYLRDEEYVEAELVLGLNPWWLQMLEPENAREAIVGAREYAEGGGS